MDNNDYERILIVDPDRNCCCVCSPDTGEPASPESPLSDWLEALSSGGVIHAEDQSRVLDFLAAEHLRAAARGDVGERRILYRRLTPDGGFHWTLLELRPKPPSACFIRIQNVHDIIQKSRELDGLDPRVLARLQWDAQMADILKSRFQIMNTVNLETGQCHRVVLNADFKTEDVRTGDYAAFIQRALEGYVHPDDANAYRNTLSLEHLREQASVTEDFHEEICVYRQLGKPMRWIELCVIYARRNGEISVNVLGRDITREKQQEEDNRHTLEERAYMIGSLSSLFFSTYYIDLENNTFRAVNQLRRVGDILGAEVDFSAGLQLYANHFIHPDDREEYLRTMDCKNLKDSLRWWSPCVAVEYRKLPDIPGNGDYEWVRASAVLARSGTDDLPKNAIYVAQSIASGRRTIPDTGSSENGSN